MQLTKTRSFDSIIFVEKKRVENGLWAKSEFLWAISFIHMETPINGEREGGIYFPTMARSICISHLYHVYLVDKSS